MKNSQKKILSLEDFISTYKYFIPKNKVTEIKSRNWLPLLQNTVLAKEFAFVCGKALGDGNLDEKYTFRFVGKKDTLVSLESVLIEKFHFSDSQIKIRNKSKYSKGESYLLQVNDSIFGRLLYLLGAPIGKKTDHPFYVPKWILEDKINSRYFLKGILEDELSTIKIAKNKYSIAPQFKLSKNRTYVNELRNFLEQIRLMIISFGVSCSSVSSKTCGRIDQNTVDLYFSINREKRNILKFRENIGFRCNKTKVKELTKCCKIIKKSLKSEM